MPPQVARGESVDRAEIAQIHLDGLGRRAEVAARDVRSASRHDYSCTGAVERPGDGQTHPRVAAGNDGSAVGQIDSVENFVSGVHDGKARSSTEV